MSAGAFCPKCTGPVTAGGCNPAMDRCVHSSAMGSDGSLFDAVRPQGFYKTMSLDPPWLERGGGKSKRGADRHYPLMPTPKIIETVLASEPYSWLAGDAHCWCWVTDNYLEDGLRLMKAMGFRYVRTLAWVKVKRHAGPAHDLLTEALGTGLLSIGLGQYLRGAHELALLGVRGNAMVPKPADRMPSVVFASKGMHSEKPQAAVDVMERCSKGPRVEMFGRKKRPNWDVWGNEAPS